MSNDTIRLGMIGVGWWATYVHLPSLQEYPGAEVVAICDRNAEQLNNAGDAFHIHKRYSDAQEMLDSEQLDGVIIATTHATHYALAKAVLERKIPLFLEKPMTLYAKEARELQKLAEDNHTPLVLGYPWQMIPEYQYLRDLIGQGEIGEIQLVSNLFSSMVLEYYRANPAAYQSVFQWKLTGPQTTTYSEPSVAGGGQGHLQVTHSAALLLWLTHLQPLEVAAFMERFDVKVDVFDAISVRFDNRAIGTLTSSGAIPAAQAKQQQFEYRIYGTKGYVLLDIIEGTSTIFYNDGTLKHLAQVPEERRFPQEMTSRHFVEVLRGQVENQSPGIIGVRTVELLEAAYRSEAEKRVVRIDEL